MREYQVGDRRPLASRSWRFSQQAANALARAGTNPNHISVAGLFCGILAGVFFALTRDFVHPAICWLGAAVCIQLRLFANLLDGMVAVARQTASAVGELFNEMPDRVSDSATLIGLGYAAGSDAVLGYIAALFAVFLAYLRAQGKVAGAHQEFCGPMAKQQRMAMVTAGAVICALLPGSTYPTVLLLLIILGSVITVFRRLTRIAAALRNR